MDPSGMLPGDMGMMGAFITPAPTASMFNNLYKTQPCKHFMQTRNCHVGSKCHFAHGEHELRKPNDVSSRLANLHGQPLPIEQTMKMMNIPYNNYKTQPCKFYEKDKSCKFGANCSFAHGAHELRNPYDDLPLIPPPAPAHPFLAEKPFQDEFGLGGPAAIA